jgi:mRNA-degrading endonuclease RelE of RelBE toxin-antitoxin system|tara:strand:+ start:86 stop:274 length:189 start_codon:yes stop_codon:yes gene_type:complete
MKIGDVVRMNHALTPERYGLGLVQKILRSREKSYRLVYHILWPDNTISCQFDNEIVLVGRVE